MTTRPDIEQLLESACQSIIDAYGELTPAELDALPAYTKTFLDEAHASALEYLNTREAQR